MLRAKIPSIAGSRFLVVVEEADVAAEIGAALERRGGVVVGSSDSADDAVRLAFDLRPDLVLLDTHLREGSDGIEAAGWIRSSLDVPIVFLTAHADEETLERSKDAAAFGYLIKPFDERNLEATIVTAFVGHRAQAELDARVAERTASLAEAVAVRDEFLLVATHELRTPVAALTLQLEALERIVEKVGDADPIRPKLLQKMRGVRSQSARLRRLVTRLLDARSIGSGYLDLRRSEFDLTEVVGAVVASLQYRAESEGCAITFESASGLVGIWDRERIEECVLDILDNALKYGPGEPIEVRVGRDDGCAVVAVRDRGIGLDPETRSQIFGRYSRAVSSRNFGGLGLGLAIVKSIVDAHGGRIEADVPADGVGAVFTLWLPLAVPSVEVTTRTLGDPVQVEGDLDP